MTAPLLAVRDWRVGFRAERGVVVAVDGVGFDLPAGGALGVVGESGSGKSALAMSLLRLLPAGGVLLGGSARFAGADLAAMPDRDLRRIRGRRIAVVFQDPMTSLNPYMRVGAQVAEPLVAHLGMGRRAARLRAVALLESVGIPEPARSAAKFPHELSGGQRQRAMIAMALGCDPELLIADEPTTALDVTVQAQVLALIRRERERRGMGLILISHNLAVVAGMCERVAVMYGGRMVEVGAAQTIFRAARHPYTRGLIGALPRLDDERGRPLASIPGNPPAAGGDRAGCAFAPRCPSAQERCRVVAPEERAAEGTTLRCHVDLPPMGEGP
ncbi:MAG TPA: ABC transporter ATP-binding protein [Planctomycetota bacterium]|nr:ABC transporter ATP-binding protein [Planctomycetota bacterium]